MVDGVGHPVAIGPGKKRAKKAAAKKPPKKEAKEQPREDVPIP